MFQQPRLYKVALPNHLCVFLLLRVPVTVPQVPLGTTSTSGAPLTVLKAFILPNLPHPPVHNDLFFREHSLIMVQMSGPMKVYIFFVLFCFVFFYLRFFYSFLNLEDYNSITAIDIALKIGRISDIGHLLREEIKSSGKPPPS